MAEVQLKIRGGDDPRLKKQMLVLRYFFYNEMRRLYSTKMNGYQYVMPKSYDMPTADDASPVCLWQRWIELVADRVNPMWAVRAAAEREFLLGRPINAWQLLKPAHAGEYLAYGQRSCHEYVLEGQTSIDSLTERMVSVQSTLGLTDPLVALEYIEGQIVLDPVLRLCYRWARNYRVTREMILSARLRWAYCPHIYEGVPAELMQRFSFEDVFGVTDGHRSHECLRVASLLRDL